jgi:methylase of polypeptide subunit release factors
MRMFMYWDPVTPDEARTALGEELSLEALLEVGLLMKTAEGGIRSPFLLGLAGDLLVFGDDVNDGGEAVMGAGPSTKALARVARPRARLPRALDVGCGAGTLALWLAQSCDQVVATDVSARAVALARMNCWLNRIANVECRVGDLLAPVEAESFDLITAQPPFVPRDAAASEATFLFGGARGDELAMRLLRGLGEHLSPGGMALLLVEWPVIEGDAPLEARVRSAVGDTGDRSILLMQWEEADIDEHCTRYATIGHAFRDDAYEREAIRRREHFEQAKIRALRPTFTIVRRDLPGAGAGWTFTVQGRRLADAHPSREQIEGLFAARDVVTRGRQALGNATLRLTSGARFAQRGEGDEVEVSFPGGGLCGPMTVNAGTVRLVGFVHEAGRVEDGIAAFAEGDGETLAELRDTALEAVEFALLHGLLEVASS